LKQIEVMNKTSGQQALFYHNGWLKGTKQSPSGATVTIPEATTAAARKRRSTVQFKVVVATGSAFGAGTDAPVFLQVGITGARQGGGWEDAFVLCWHTTICQWVCVRVPVELFRWLTGCQVAHGYKDN